jgi:hypothetical protein
VGVIRDHRAEVICTLQQQVNQNQYCTISSMCFGFKCCKIESDQNINVDIYSKQYRMHTGQCLVEKLLLFLRRKLLKRLLLTFLYVYRELNP